MLSKEKIKEIVISRINQDEKPGDQGGGSGHMSHVDCEINEISEPVKEDNNWKIVYKYTKYISTEFTYYPDNPPYEYPCTKEILLDKKGNVIDK
ncbi:hypothetical protein ACFLTI_04645 [Bacteroidota bacterium]